MQVCEFNAFVSSLLERNLSIIQYLIISKQIDYDSKYSLLQEYLSYTQNLIIQALQNSLIVIRESRSSQNSYYSEKELLLIHVS